MLNDVINNSQRGDGNATLSLINKFNPLLKKYSRKLYYEDAYNDLLIDFLELLHDMQTDSLRDRCDAVTVSYIATSIHNSYVRRLAWIKKSQTTLLYAICGARRPQMRFTSGHLALAAATPFRWPISV